MNHWHDDPTAHSGTATAAAAARREREEREERCEEIYTCLVLILIEHCGKHGRAWLTHCMETFAQSYWNTLTPPHHKSIHYLKPRWSCSWLLLPMLWFVLVFVPRHDENERKTNQENNITSSPVLLYYLLIGNRIFIVFFFFLRRVVCTVCARARTKH